MAAEKRVRREAEAVEVLEFASGEVWELWLEENHSVSDGIWLRFFRKHSGIASVSYAEALDAALCYGWIDGQLKKHDEDSWLQRFTPRRPRSVWSKRNREHIERLTKAERMRAAGLKQVEAAKADGRWESAYDSPKNMKVPEDFLTELRKNKKAHAFFGTLSKANVYAIAWRLQTAKKPETRQRRMAVILEKLKKREKLHLF